MFLLIFSAFLLFANVFLFIRKKYIYLFVPCMLFLPEFYGIEISASLPIITVTRIMFLIFYVYVLLNKRRTIKISLSELKTLPREYYLLAAYFILRIITNLFYITTYAQAVKTIFSIVFEQLLFVIAIILLSPTKEEIITTIKSVVWSATVLFFIGISETLTFVRPFDQLYTVSRYMLNDHYIRLGLLRATTTMGLPGLFGNACILILPLILYLHWLTKHKKYLIAILIDLLGVIHSGSRSDVFFFLFIILIYSFLLLVLQGSTAIVNTLKNTAIVLSLLLLITGLLSFASPYYRYFYIGNAKSVLNEVGFDFDLNEGAPEGIDGYGTNSGANGNGGVNSRLHQLSGIKYALEHSPLVGLGSGAQNRNEVYYFVYGNWYPYSTFDIAIVEVIYCEGLIGLLAYFMLIIYWFICLYKYSIFGVLTAKV